MAVSKIIRGICDIYGVGVLGWNMIYIDEAGL